MYECYGQIVIPPSGRCIGGLYIRYEADYPLALEPFVSPFFAPDWL